MIHIQSLRDTAIHPWECGPVSGRPVCWALNLSPRVPMAPGSSVLYPRCPSCSRCQASICPLGWEGPLYLLVSTLFLPFLCSDLEKASWQNAGVAATGFIPYVSFSSIFSALCCLRFRVWTCLLYMHFLDLWQDGFSNSVMAESGSQSCFTLHL